MIKVRRAAERGGANHGWLDTRHTFSFSDYYDPRHMGFRTLRVINEDRVQPGQGFGTHPHRDMEIVTYVLSGALAHKDSMGNGSVLRPGELQHMTAGTGIRHSEFNPDPDRPAHFYQIWLLSAERGLPPAYDQKAFDPALKRGRLLLVASPDGRDGSLLIRQNAGLYLADLAEGGAVEHAFAPGRHGWLQVLGGRVGVNGLDLAAGDGLAVSDEPALRVRAAEAAEVMLFDLA
jgi:redox-sensitive bicupin YhaK (pirin superfamily)